MGTFEWNIQTNEIRWSDNLEAIHGMPPGTFDGTFESFQSLIHRDDRAGVLENIRRSVETGADYEAEFRSATADGSTHWILGKGKVLRDEHGGPWRMIGICMDITSRKRAEEALRESDRRKDEFLAMISHELRNPLFAIANASSVLDTWRPRIRSRPRRTSMIRRQTEHLTRIVNDLLDIARLTAGKLVLQQTRLDLGALVEKCVAELAGSHLLDRHVYDVRVSPALVNGDSARLEQIVTNLLTNAVKYTPAGRPGDHRGRYRRRRGGAAACATPASVSRRICCRASSICSSRANAASIGATAAWGSASRSFASWSRRTAGMPKRSATAPTRAPRSSSACR